MIFELLNKKKDPGFRSLLNFLHDKLSICTCLFGVCHADGANALNDVDNVLFDFRNVVGDRGNVLEQMQLNFQRSILL